MTKVRLLVNGMHSGRYVPAGTVLELAPEQAKYVVEAGNGEYVDAPAPAPAKKKA